MRNPKTYKNLENSDGEKPKVTKNIVEEEAKKEYTVDEFGNKKFGKLKSFTESKSFQQSMSKEFEAMAAKENAKRLPIVNLKSVRGREA